MLAVNSINSWKVLKGKKLLIHFLQTMLPSSILHFGLKKWKNMQKKASLLNQQPLVNIVPKKTKKLKKRRKTRAMEENVVMGWLKSLRLDDQGMWK